MKNKINKKSTLREVLQIFGTELLREGFNENIHVASTMGGIPLNDNVIITDTRFPNELRAVEQKGGITIRVTRPKAREVFLMNANEVIDTTVVEHISERALDSALFQYEITNDGTLDELIDKVREILEKEGLLTKTE